MSNNGKFNLDYEESLLMRERNNVLKKRLKSIFTISVTILRTVLIDPFFRDRIETIRDLSETKDD